MLRVIAELFENTSGQLVRVPVAFASATGTERVHGSVHEVETVRRRCVEGSVVYNLGSLESNLFGKLRTKSYAATGLTDASNVPWLKSLRQDLNLFVDALVFCTESRSLTQDSLQEVRPPAHADPTTYVHTAHKPSPVLNGASFIAMYDLL